MNERDLRKHRQDVLRLFPLISENENIMVSAEIYNDIHQFIDTVEAMSFESNQIGIPVSKGTILDIYRNIYRSSVV